VTVADFLQQAARHGIRQDAFSLTGCDNESYCLEEDAQEWTTFYSEHGLRRDVAKHQSESKALTALLDMLLTDLTTRK
jgi:hypothetical protein